MNIKKTSIKV